MANKSYALDYTKAVFGVSTDLTVCVPTTLVLDHAGKVDPTLSALYGSVLMDTISGLMCDENPGGKVPSFFLIGFAA